MRISYLFLTLCVSASLFLASCRKKEEEKKVADLTSVESTNDGRNVDNTDLNILNDQAQGLGGVKKTQGLTFPQGTLISNSLTVAGQDTTYKVVIDFGASANGLLCSFDGLYRKGKIIYDFTEKDATGTFETMATFSDYYVGKTAANMKREGTIAERYGINSQLKPYRSYVINGAKLYTADGTKAASWTRDEMAVWTDDKSGSGYWSITGSGTGTELDGGTYNITIDQLAPLRVDKTCEHPVSGKVVITQSGKTMTIDYSTGGCDRATISVDGQSYELDLNLR